MQEEWEERIEVNPEILMGRPAIAGARVPVYAILDLLVSGYDPASIVEAYPGLCLEDVPAALQCAEQRMPYEEAQPLTADPTPA